MSGGGESCSSSLHLNVREIFTRESMEETTQISKKINLEIGRKQEELRMLVGERYRDLIDAADTIGTMRVSSLKIYSQLCSLRDELSSIPSGLLPPPPPTLTQDRLKGGKAEKNVSPQELEMVVHLKLSVQIAREIRVLLGAARLPPALHLFVYFEEKLNPALSPFKWALYAEGVVQPTSLVLTLKEELLECIQRLSTDLSTPTAELGECLVAKQILTQRSPSQVLREWIRARVEQLEGGLSSGGSAEGFVQDLGHTTQAIYALFIDPQVYMSVGKVLRKPQVGVAHLGLNCVPSSLAEFNGTLIGVEEGPRVAQLAEIVMEELLLPLKAIIQPRVHTLLVNEQSFEQLGAYKERTMSTLKETTQDLMKLVLGTSKSVWTEVFAEVFEQRSRSIARDSIQRCLKFMEHDALPRLLKGEDQFDLVGFLWKAEKVSETKLSAHLNAEGVNSSKPLFDWVDLKLKCFSTPLALIAQECEVHLEEMHRDFVHLLSKDPQVKQFISSHLLHEMSSLWERLMRPHEEEEGERGGASNLPLARFSSALDSLTPTLWKLMEKNDGLELKRTLGQVSEACWKSCSSALLTQFIRDLGGKLQTGSEFNSSHFMPRGEEFGGQEGEVNASIRIPYQLSHGVHSALYALCLTLAKISAAQSMPKSVRENFRLQTGLELVTLYRGIWDKGALTPQVAAQLIFDLKFIGWFHSQLPERAEFTTLITSLETLIDPFDVDLLSPRLKVNLKRFLFETHLTLGLLFAEETQSFIGTNFKRKDQGSWGVGLTSLSSPLPLLPL